MPLSSLSNQLQQSIHCSLEQLSSSAVHESTCLSFAGFVSAGASLAAALTATVQSGISGSISHVLQISTNAHSLLTSPPTPASNLPNASPTQSEIVSITGALIVFTVLFSCVLLTQLFDAIDDLLRRCRPLISRSGDCASSLQKTETDSKLSGIWSTSRWTGWLTGRLRKRVNWIWRHLSDIWMLTIGIWLDDNLEKSIIQITTTILINQSGWFVFILLSYHFIYTVYSITCFIIRVFRFFCYDQNWNP